MGMEDYGSIRVAFPVGNARAVTQDSAAAATDYYEIVVYDSQGNFYHGSSNPGTSDIFIPDGSYSVLVLAGEQNYSYFVSLLGSAFAEDVQVYPCKRTDVDVQLNSIDFVVSAPEQVYCSEEFIATVEGNSNNRVLHEPSYLKLRDSNSNGQGNMSGTVDGPAFSYTGTITAPLFPGSETYSPGHYPVQFVDPVMGVNTDLAPSSLVTLECWIWPSSSSIYLDSPVADSVYQTVIFVEAPTGIEVTITW